jgi:carotenoid 1,2-hydratase
VVAGGYRWWYVDALSDDGRHGMTLIAFVGSVFSPYYAFARRRNPLAVPEDHCAVNAILYGPRSKHWSCTERGAGDLVREADHLVVGPSTLSYLGDNLVADVREVTVPWPRRLTGRILLEPESEQAQQFSLDPRDRHHWWPVAPMARVTVEFEHPALRWQGHGYFDTNWGDEPLEDGFSHWHWSRAIAPTGDVSVIYEAWPRSGDSRLICRRFHADGGSSELCPPAATAMPVTPVWRMGRPARGAVGVARTLEDTPFYARSLLRDDAGQMAMHESLDLDRFRSPWVQCLLPFRMPRFPRGRSVKEGSQGSR